MLGKRGWAFIVACASLLLAAPASATVTYTFTSDDGDFVFTSPSFFDGGVIPGPGGTVVSHSENLVAVDFRGSDILLVTPGCVSNDSCFDATFLEGGIFQRTGTFFASDGGAKILIVETSTASPVPEPSTWTLLAIGLAGFGCAKGRKIWSVSAFG